MKKGRLSPKSLQGEDEERYNPKLTVTAHIYHSKKYFCVYDS